MWMGRALFSAVSVAATPTKGPSSRDLKTRVSSSMARGAASGVPVAQPLPTCTAQPRHAGESSASNAAERVLPNVDIEPRLEGHGQERTPEEPARPAFDLRAELHLRVVEQV